MAQDEAELWLRTERARTEESIRGQVALLPRFLAAHAAHGGRSRAQARKLLKTPPEVLLKELAAAARASEALIVYGDSWLTYKRCLGQVPSNMSERLVARGFEVYAQAANSGARIIDLAKQGNIERLTKEYRRALADQLVPKAVILCGGGNDAVGNNRFYDLLNEAGSGNPGLNDAAVRQRVDSDIRNAYLSILDWINQLNRQFFQGREIPVLMHGYDFPVPDSRSACHLIGPWLGPHFLRRGYTQPEDRKRFAADLIKHFNDMQAGLPAPSGLDLRHIRLTGTLSTEEADYEEAWENELHPTPAGFGRITEAFLEKWALSRKVER